MEFKYDLRDPKFIGSDFRSLPELLFGLSLVSTLALGASSLLNVVKILHV